MQAVQDFVLVKCIDILIDRLHILQLIMNLCFTVVAQNICLIWLDFFSFVIVALVSDCSSI